MSFVTSWGGFDSELIEWSEDVEIDSADIRVDVYKVGGGTIDERYANEMWAVQITEVDNGNVLVSTDAFYVGHYVNHSEVVWEALEWLRDDSEN